jgi:hypothetical protein
MSGAQIRFQCCHPCLLRQYSSKVSARSRILLGPNYCSCGVDTNSAILKIDKKFMGSN